MERPGRRGGDGPGDGSHWPWRAVVAEARGGPPERLRRRGAARVPHHPERGDVRGDAEPRARTAPLAVPGGLRPRVYHRAGRLAGRRALCLELRRGEQWLHLAPRDHHPRPAAGRPLELGAKQPRGLRDGSSRVARDESALLLGLRLRTGSGVLSVPAPTTAGVPAVRGPGPATAARAARRAVLLGGWRRVGDRCLRRGVRGLRHLAHGPLAALRTLGVCLRVGRVRGVLLGDGGGWPCLHRSRGSPGIPLHSLSAPCCARGVRRAPVYTTVGSRGAGLAVHGAHRLRAQGSRAIQQH